MVREPSSEALARSPPAPGHGRRPRTATQRLKGPPGPAKCRAWLTAPCSALRTRFKHCFPCIHSFTHQFASITQHPLESFPVLGAETWWWTSGRGFPEPKPTRKAINHHVRRAQTAASRWPGSLRPLSSMPAALTCLIARLTPAWEPPACPGFGGSGMCRSRDLCPMPSAASATCCQPRPHCSRGLTCSPCQALF